MPDLEMLTYNDEPVVVPARAVEDLRGALLGELLLPSDTGYDVARAVWNGLTDRRPALIARCSGPADVLVAVRFARERDLLVSVRGGAHNVAGNAVCDGGLMIDLSAMRGVRVDPVARTARAQGGVTWGELDHETQLYALATPGGVVSDTGIAGLTLGGGAGWLRGTFGLSCDNLRSADVVTAEARTVIAGPGGDSDLLWALRGGGGNFGVVTSFEYDLHPVGPMVMFALVNYPSERAGDVLRAFRAFMATAPDEISALGSLWRIPDEEAYPEEVRGKPAVLIAACYAGPVDEGERAVAPLRALGSPILDSSGVMPFVDVQRAFDADYPWGWYYYWKSHYLDDLTDEVIDLTVERAFTAPSPHTNIDIWPLGQAVQRYGPEDAAFGRRDARYAVTVEANWDDRHATDRNVAWARDCWEALRPLAQGGMYPNFAGITQESLRVVRASYPGTFERLVAMKRRYDPDNFFRRNLNIPPDGP